ncbi:MFS transporter [Plantibacter sp. Mn2098]|uniref:MFS transporter n=1 Tax=Plantibacter sp. Mn2098 TaxID=3395266 RepID=UPI003BCFD346
MNTTTPTTSTTPTPPTPRSTRRWAALAVLALAQFLVVLDASIVNIALPVIGEHLDMDTTTLAWVITAYVLPFGGLLLLGGRLADRYGHRRLFLIGTAGFVAASAMAGLSVTSGMLLGARALQGASAALLAPAALALVTHLFPLAKDRVKALGIWGAVAGIGSAAGVLLGGILTATLGWEAVFFVNVPVGAVVLIAIPMLVTRDLPAARTRLDYAGAATVTGSLVSFVGALSSAERLGFLHPLTLGLFVAAVVLGAAFIVIQRRTEQPLVPLGVFRNRNLSIGNVVVLLVGAGMVALFFALSVYLQAVLHYDALTAGLSQLPLAGALVLVAGVVPSIVARIGTKTTLIASLLVLAGGLVWLSMSPADAGFVADILGPSLLIGIGIGGALVTATQVSVDGVDGGESGLAGGLVNTSQQIGGALGIAVLSSIAAARTGALEAAGASTGVAMTAGFSLVFLGAAGLTVLGALTATLLRTSTGDTSPATATVQTGQVQQV